MKGRACMGKIFQRMASNRRQVQLNRLHPRNLKRHAFRSLHNNSLPRFYRCLKVSVKGSRRDYNFLNLPNTAFLWK